MKRLGTACDSARHCFPEAPEQCNAMTGDRGSVAMLPASAIMFDMVVSPLKGFSSTARVTCPIELAIHNPCHDRVDLGAVDAHVLKQVIGELLQLASHPSHKDGAVHAAE